MLRGVVYRLLESLASMGHSSIWKLICAISVCNTLTVGVHIPSTPSISGPGSATDHTIITITLVKCHIDIIITLVLQSSWHYNHTAITIVYMYWYIDELYSLRLAKCMVCYVMV